MSEKEIILFLICVKKKSGFRETPPPFPPISAKN